MYWLHAFLIVCFRCWPFERRVFCVGTWTLFTCGCVVGFGHHEIWWSVSPLLFPSLSWFLVVPSDFRSEDRTFAKKEPLVKRDNNNNIHQKDSKGWTFFIVFMPCTDNFTNDFPWQKRVIVGCGQWKLGFHVACAKVMVFGMAPGAGWVPWGGDFWHVLMPASCPARYQMMTCCGFYGWWEWFEWWLSWLVMMFKDS